MCCRVAMETPPVELTVSEGPVILQSVGGEGVEATRALWNDMSAREFFPACSGSAFYTLSLSKAASRVDVVEDIEGELTAALHILAAAWPFSGGSFMALATREVVTSARCQSNAGEVRRQLLARAGLTRVAATTTIAAEWGSTYLAPPLGKAAAIGKAAVKDYALYKLLHYHQTAWLEYYYRSRVDRSSWFITLYKVRELLQKIHMGEGGARSRLDIHHDDWAFFGRLLNNDDLRHAELSGKPPSLLPSDVDRAYRLARDWTATHLTVLGLQVLL